MPRMFNVDDAFLFPVGEAQGLGIVLPDYSVLLATPTGEIIHTQFMPDDAKVIESSDLTSEQSLFIKMAKLTQIYLKAAEPGATVKTIQGYKVAFTFEGEIYYVLSSPELRQNGRVVLPDGRILIIGNWDDEWLPQPRDISFFEKVPMAVKV